MPGRSFNSGDYRYGFNGMEKDDEIKNLGGTSLDFGSRVYDPRLGRWLSLDPLQAKLPYLTPYNFVANNPIRFIDVDGQFLLDVHQRIMRNALAHFAEGVLAKKDPNSGDWLTTDENTSFIYGMIGDGSSMDVNAGITDPDLFHSGELPGTSYDASMHFDNMKFPEIMGNLAKIQSMLNSNIEAYNEGRKSAYDLGFNVGVASHAIQDLYSHSNYIELYVEAYSDQEGGDVAKIPTIDQALSDPAFSKFAALIKTKLVTGTYPGEGFGSHKEMNHDVGKGSIWRKLVGETKYKSVYWRTEAAEAVATKAEVELLQKIKDNVIKTE